MDTSIDTMELENITSEIKKFFAESSIVVKRMILFGSRAKGTAGNDSDWDFLAIIDRKIDFEIQNRIRTLIRRRLAKQRISVDIIIRSESAYEKDRTDTGNITYYAVKEGVAV
jgi:predicted nucleotidyltransferase